MTLKEALGLGSAKKIRYAIVGLGDISQEDMMPGVEHTGNSEMTALVSSDPAKTARLAEKYGVKATYSYEQFNEAIHSGIFDAIYLATPNWRHAEFIVPALKAGIHVLAEKPLEDLDREVSGDFGSGTVLFRQAHGGVPAALRARHSQHDRAGKVGRAGPCALLLFNLCPSSSIPAIIASTPAISPGRLWTWGRIR